MRQPRTATALLGVAVALLLAAGPRQAAAAYSSWIKDLSAAADPEGLYTHYDAKVATSENVVHVVWCAYKRDFTEKRIFYARSVDGGGSFPTPVALVSGDPSVIFPAEWRSLAASGPYVHLVYAYGWPRNLVYLRSQNRGTTFQPTSLFSGYNSYLGVCIAAQNNKVALVWDSNNGNGAMPKDIICDYSTDGGASFQRTGMAHSEGTTIWSYAVQDLVRSGDFVYALTTTQDENWYSTQKHLYLWASTDGGASFKSPVKVNVKAVNEGYYLGQLQDAQYSPNLAASGQEVNIVWVNVDDPGAFDGWAALSLRVRESSDAGTSLEDAVILHTFPEGYNHGAHFGQETIIRQDQDVYVSTIVTSGASGTYLWRSCDGGANWGTGQQLSHEGWWPLLATEPPNPDLVHLFNGRHHTSEDAGEVFDGGVIPHYNFTVSWWAPQLAIDSEGIPHYVGMSDDAILYRRLAPEPTPGALNQAVLLRQNSLYGPRLCDHLQVPAQSAINFSDAVTVEFWVKRLSDDAGYFQKLVNKKRTSGEGSYVIGAWSDMTFYARLVTETTDPANGAFLASSEVLAKGEWTHLAMTYDANAGVNNWRLYVDGNLAASASLTGLIQTETADAPLVISRDKDPLPADGEVAIDELRLWNRARTQDEIRRDRRRRLAATQEGLAASYRFDGSFQDSSGHSGDALPMYHESFVAGPVLETPLSPMLLLLCE